MRVAIVGLGLIGGSLARALTARGHEVMGVDEPRARRRARAAGAIGEGSATVEEAARAVEVQVLSAPPRANSVDRFAPKTRRLPRRRVRARAQTKTSTPPPTR